VLALCFIEGQGIAAGFMMLSLFVLQMALCWLGDQVW
jgi:hypothetical protein